MVRVGHRADAEHEPRQRASSFPISSARAFFRSPNAARCSLAQVFWLSLTAGDKPFAAEDRAISAMAQPPCISKQLTHTTAMSFNSTSGVLSFEFTRPAKVSAAEEELGYISFVDELQHVIGAIGSNVRPTKKCEVTQAEHYGAFTLVSVNFLQQ